MEEIILVTCIDLLNSNLEKTRAFDDSTDADEYATMLIKQIAADLNKSVSDDDIEYYLDQGFYEVTTINSHICIYINSIPLYRHK